MTPMGPHDLRGKRILVIGLGKSGVAAASLALRAGASVAAVDGAARDRLSPDALALEGLGVKIASGGLERVLYEGWDWIVISPGVPRFAQLSSAETEGARVIGEVEFASWFLPAVPVLAITGSNGKSTTVTLVGELLARAGLRPFVGGNLGDPPCAFVGPERIFDHEAVVLEISSFQAERVPSFRANAVALLNVSPNHLDRYDDFDGYVAAKGNLFENQRAGDIAVVPDGDALCAAQAARGPAMATTFATQLGSSAPYGFTRDEILDRRLGFAVPRKSIRLAGDHNASNICAALALVSALELSRDVIMETLTSFEGLAHRIVRVASKRGVTYYDDSKGTNVGATVAAILGLSEEKVVLIAGGRDKMGSYDPLAKALVERGRGAVLIGEAADKIAAALSHEVPVRRAGSMEEAVKLASELARPGDAVLLSPACSSFDMFRDYKDRGAAFVDAARALPDA